MYKRQAQREAERLTAEAEALNPGADPASRQQPFAANRLVHDSLLVRAALSRRLGEEEPRSVACVFDFASRLASSPEDLTPEENAVFMNLLLGAKDAIRGDGDVYKRQRRPLPFRFPSRPPSFPLDSIDTKARCSRLNVTVSHYHNILRQ